MLIKIPGKLDYFFNGNVEFEMRAIYRRPCDHSDCMLALNTIHLTSSWKVCRKHWIRKMLCTYILSIACISSPYSVFSPLWLMQHTGLCNMSWPISYLMIGRIFVLHIIIIMTLAILIIQPVWMGMFINWIHTTSSQLSRRLRKSTCTLFASSLYRHTY